MPRAILLTLNEVLDELGDGEKPLPKSTFYDWKSKGRAPRCIRLPNGKLRIRESELRRWLTELEDGAR